MKMQMTRKTILAVLGIVLCLSVSVGGAMAYFTDYEDGRGSAVLNLGGETEINEGSDGYDKHIVILNTGETNMMVRTAIFGNEGEKYMTVTAGEGWILGADGFYYYNKVIEPAEATTAIDAVLKAEWKGEEEHPDLKDMEITVVHESAQAILDMETQTLLVPNEKWDASIVAQMAIPANPQGEEVTS